MKITIEYKNEDSFVLPKVTRADYAGDYSIALTFSDGVKRKVDFGAFLKKRPHPQYNKYNNTENFKQFKIENGNIVWGQNEDLAFHVESLYEGKIM